MIKQEEVGGLKAACDETWTQICAAALDKENAPIVSKESSKLANVSMFITELVHTAAKNRWWFDMRAFRTAMVHAASVALRAIIWADERIAEQKRQQEDACENCGAPLPGNPKDVWAQTLARDNSTHRFCTNSCRATWLE